MQIQLVRMYTTDLIQELLSSDILYSNIEDTVVASWSHCVRMGVNYSGEPVFPSFDGLIQQAIIYLKYTPIIYAHSYLTTVLF